MKRDLFAELMSGFDALREQRPKARYWLVSEKAEGSKEIALVRSFMGYANTVAGDQKVAYDFHPSRDFRNKGLFLNGEPKPSDVYGFEVVAGVFAGHPFISDMIAELGYPVWDKREIDAKRSLEVARNRSAAQAARKERPADFDEQIYDLFMRGVKVLHIANKFGITKTSVRRAVERHRIAVAVEATKVAGNRNCAAA